MASREAGRLWPEAVAELPDVSCDSGHPRVDGKGVSDMERCQAFSSHVQWVAAWSRKAGRSHMLQLPRHQRFLHG